MIGTFFAAACDKGNILTFPHWWKYLDVGPDPAGGCIVDFHMPGDVWLVLLAVIDILLRVAGIVAIIMIIAAGFKYVMAIGNAEKATSARKSIVNALIGLAITLTATVFVAFIGNKLGA